MIEMMTAKKIDQNGIWHSERRGKVPLLENYIPVPADVRTRDDSEPCLFIAQVNRYLSDCPVCDEPFDNNTIILRLQTVALLPAKCCDLMMWFIMDVMPIFHPMDEGGADER